VTALELQEQPDLRDNEWNVISLSLSLPDRAALSRIAVNIRDVTTDVVKAGASDDSIAFARLCRLALRWLDASTASVERVFDVPFDNDDRHALQVCAPYLRRLATRDWSPADWKKGELADWKVMWALMLDLGDSINEAEQAASNDGARPI